MSEDGEGWDNADEEAHQQTRGSRGPVLAMHKDHGEHRTTIKNRRSTYTTGDLVCHVRHLPRPSVQRSCEWDKPAAVMPHSSTFAKICMWKDVVAAQLEMGNR